MITIKELMDIVYKGLGQKYKADRVKIYVKDGSEKYPISIAEARGNGKVEFLYNTTDDDDTITYADLIKRLMKSKVKQNDELVAVCNDGDGDETEVYSIDFGKSAVLLSIDV